MTLADYSMVGFALLNSCRAIAYVPQMVRVYRDPHGAAAVSVTIWALFTAANVATAFYAITAFFDVLMAIIFGLNALGCALIAAMTVVKRTTQFSLAKERISSCEKFFRPAATVAVLAVLTTVLCWLGAGATAAAEKAPLLAKVCSDREATVVTLIEDHGNGMYVRPFVTEETLVWAGMRWLDARIECYRGNVVKAVALYDEIVMRMSRPTARTSK
jgi:hypothetical protein